MSKILYHERKHVRAPAGLMHYPATDYVEVWVRSWSCEGMMASDIVVEQKAMVDGKLVVDNRAAYPCDQSDAAFIRKGIYSFDCLLAAHPNKDKLAPEPLPDDLPF